MVKHFILLMINNKDYSFKHVKETNRAFENKSIVIDVVFALIILIKKRVICIDFDYF